MYPISRRVRQAGPSPTMAADARAKARMAAGEDIVNLAAGEPDFDSPVGACDAGVRAIREGWTRYGPAQGLPALREAIAASRRRDLGLTDHPGEILVTVGGKHALMNLFHAVLDPGDEVIVPSPCWVSYPAMVALAGGRAVMIPSRADDGFVPDPDQIAAAITPRTRILCMSSPSNPTGAGYPREVVEALGELALRHDLLLCSDEVYRRIVYDGFDPVSPAQLGPEVRARTIVVDSVSKAYAMTGWRVGWAVGPAPVIAAMSIVQSQTTSGVPTMNQLAAIAALELPDDALRPMYEAYARRRELALATLSEIPGVRTNAPRGAFYCFPDVGELFGRRAPDGRVVQTAADLQELLLDAGVAVVSGEPFQAPRHLRLSFAARDEALARGLERARGALSALT